MINEFLEYILELLEPAGGVSSRQMFGGHIIYKNELPIALISDNEIYFKVSEINQFDFESMGSKPFTYDRKGKTNTLAYWSVPPEILESEDKLIEWVEKAYQISLEAKRKKQ